MANILVIAIGAILMHNFVLSRFLGLCPFVGVSKKTETAIGMGMAVIFVMTLASAVTWAIWTYMLSPGEGNIFWIVARSFGSQADAMSFDLRYLETIAFILIIASLVQFVELVLKKMSPALYDSLGIFLPLITTNCAILGVAELNTMTEGYNFIESVVHGTSAGIGFTLALIMMSGIRERLEFAPIPKLMRGLPIAFIIAGLMSMAFLGFSGLKF